MVDLHFRRMFPALKTTVSGLEPASKYYILLDLCLADDSRYKVRILSSFHYYWVDKGVCHNEMIEGSHEIALSNLTGYRRQWTGYFGKLFP